jgi:hypothetical protein
MLLLIIRERFTESNIGEPTFVFDLVAHDIF